MGFISIIDLIGKIHMASSVKEVEDILDFFKVGISRMSESGQSRVANAVEIKIKKLKLAR